MKKKRRSYVIREVYEADSVTCPKRKREIRTIGFIDQPEVIWDFCGQYTAIDS